ncbi:MAG: hypothetical protein OCD76_04410 [Reichenbachiella sp.]
MAIGKSVQLTDEWVTYKGLFRTSGSGDVKLTFMAALHVAKMYIDDISIIEFDPTDKPQVGTLYDHRDGQSYTTVEARFMTWMTQNLNYWVAGSQCYNNNPAHCETYGRLYSFDEVMNNDAQVPKAQGICPDGWHIPSSEEFLMLFEYAEWYERNDKYDLR